MISALFVREMSTIVPLSTQMTMFEVRFWPTYNDMWT